MANFSVWICKEEHKQAGRTEGRMNTDLHFQKVVDLFRPDSPPEVLSNAWVYVALLLLVYVPTLHLKQQQSLQ